MLDRRLYQHGEAFMLMLYRSDDGAVEEYIWNSRDGVTPFCVQSQDGSTTLTHVEWNRDRRLLDYQPKPGERYFLTMTKEAARRYAFRKVERLWAELKATRRHTKAEWVRVFEDEMRPGEGPDIATVPREAGGSE